MLRTRAVTLLLALAAALVGMPALFGDYVYDDLELIARRPAVLDFDLPALLGNPHFTGDAGYWRPLTMLLLAAGHHLGGPLAIHAAALALHTGNTLLVFGLARRALPQPAAAAAAAGWFAVHPLQAEALAWCAAINDPLWVAGALLACRAALRWRDAGASGTPWRAAAWFGGALLAKENALVTPLLVAAAWRHLPAAAAVPSNAGRRLAAALATVGCAWWLLRTLVFGSPTAGLLGGATPAFSAWRQLSAPAELAVRHLGLLVWPWPLSPFRPFAGEVTPGQALAFLGAAAALAVVLLRCWRHASAHVRLCFAFLLLPWSPVLVRWASLGAYPLADRYLYLALAGQGLGFGLATARWRRAPWLLLPMLGVATALQTRVWHDQASLVQHGLTAHPVDANLQVMAGDLALQQAQRGEPTARERARRHYQQALTLAQADTGPTAHRAEPGALLGLAFCLWLDEPAWRPSGGRTLVEAFNRAVAADPTRAAAHIGLGIARAATGDAHAAERAFREALRLDPHSSEAWCNLGRLQLGLGQRAAARASLQEALRWGPGNAAARELLTKAQ